MEIKKVKKVKEKKKDATLQDKTLEDNKSNPLFERKFVKTILHNQPETFWLEPAPEELACFFCGRLNFKTPPIPDPLEIKDDGTIVWENIYCSPVCCKSDIFYNFPDSIKNECLDNFNVMMMNVYDYRDNVPVVHKKMFKWYGGYLTVTDYVYNYLNNVKLNYKIRGNPFIHLPLLLEGGLAPFNPH